MGKELATKIRNDLKDRVINFIKKKQITPHLAVSVVTTCSVSYVTGKQKGCKEVNMNNINQITS